MSSYEFTEWMAYFRIEEYERNREVKAQEAAQKVSNKTYGPDAFFK